jgi:hypothetical protein
VRFDRALSEAERLALAFGEVRFALQRLARLVDDRLGTVVLLVDDDEVAVAGFLHLQPLLRQRFLRARVGQVLAAQRDVLAADLHRHAVLVVTLGLAELALLPILRERVLRSEHLTHSGFRLGRVELLRQIELLQLLRLEKAAGDEVLDRLLVQRLDLRARLLFRHSLLDEFLVLEERNGRRFVHHLQPRQRLHAPLVDLLLRVLDFALRLSDVERRFLRLDVRFLERHRLERVDAVGALREGLAVERGVPRLVRHRRALGERAQRVLGVELLLHALRLQDEQVRLHRLRDGSIGALVELREVQRA